MRRVPLLATVLAALGVLLGLVVPSSAAPDEGVLLRGGRTAYVDLYVYENSTLNPADLRLTGRGSYYGFFMAPSPYNRPSVGALVMPRVGATGGAELMKLGESWDLRAGKYRMYLLADGPADVFVPIPGQGLRGYTPRGQNSISVRRADASFEAGSPGVTQRVPVPLRYRSLVVAAEQVVSDSLTAVDSLGTCVGAGSPACAADDATRVPAATAWTYHVAFLQKAGNYSAVLGVSRHGGYDAGGRVNGVVLVLTVGIQP